MDQAKVVTRWISHVAESAPVLLPVTPTCDVVLPNCSLEPGTGIEVIRGGLFTLAHHKMLWAPALEWLPTATISALTVANLKHIHVSRECQPSVPCDAHFSIFSCVDGSKRGVSAPVAKFLESCDLVVPMCLDSGREDLDLTAPPERLHVTLQQWSLPGTYPSLELDESTLQAAVLTRFYEFARHICPRVSAALITQLIVLAGVSGWARSQLAGVFPHISLIDAVMAIGLMDKSLHCREGISVLGLCPFSLLRDKQDQFDVVQFCNELAAHCSIPLQ